MRNHIKKFISGSIVTLLLTTSIFTQTITASELFCDVHETDWFYPAVSEMVKDGSVNGYPDGSFDPFGKITAAEAINILQKSFRDASKVPADGDWNSYPWHMNGWIPADLFFGDYSVSISRNTACKLILLARNEVIMDQDLYPSDPEIKEPVSDAIYTCKQRGYVSGYGNGYFGGRDMLTRAQFCEMLRNIKHASDHEIELPSDPILQIEYRGFGDNHDSFTMGAVKSLQAVPEELKHVFDERGYTFVVANGPSFTSYLSQYFSDPSGAVGCFSADNKLIIVNAVSEKNVLHEFGHFLRYEFGSIDAVTPLYDSEKSEFLISTATSYGGQNAEEYFAEAFVYYITAPDRLKKAAPQTYDYIDSLMASVVPAEP